MNTTARRPGRTVLGPRSELPAWLAPALDAWRRFGWIGVDLFFVLSGFLVSGLLFQEHRRHGALRPLHFLGRRGFKIYPAFWLLLLVTTLVLGWNRNLVNELLFVQNYRGGMWNHTWSLAIEEHFYLAIGLGFAALVRWRGGPDPFRGLPAFGLVLGACVLALRAWTFRHGDFLYLLLPTHLRIDALFFGVVLAYVAHTRPERWSATVKRRALPICVLSCALLLPSLLRPLERDAFVNTAGLTLNYLGFGGLLALAHVLPFGRAVRWLAPLRVIGVHSYSIYLWHMAVHQVCVRALQPRLGTSAALFLYLGGSVLVGIALGRWVEGPFLALRERVLPARSRA